MVRCGMWHTVLPYQLLVHPARWHLADDVRARQPGAGFKKHLGCGMRGREELGKGSPISGQARRLQACMEHIGPSLTHSRYEESDSSFSALLYPFAGQGTRGDQAFSFVVVVVLVSPI